MLIHREQEQEGKAYYCNQKPCLFFFLGFVWIDESSVCVIYRRRLRLEDGYNVRERKRERLNMIESPRRVMLTLKLTKTDQ